MSNVIRRQAIGDLLVVRIDLTARGARITRFIPIPYLHVADRHNAVIKTR
jgi:hypothetical protein